jgi:hypothetical protein
MLLSNEFATVDVEIDNQAKGPRLKIEDPSVGLAIYLDPLELQALAWARHEDLAQFTEPAFRERAADRLVGRALARDAVQQADRLLQERRAAPDSDDSTTQEDA